VLSASFADRASSSFAQGENGSIETSKRLGHDDLIARAREVGRQTADAIERARSGAGLDCSRLDSSMLSAAEPSLLNRTSALSQPPRSSDSPAVSVLQSTRVVEALKRGATVEVAASPRAASSSACLSSPRPSMSRAASPPRSERHPDLHWGATSMIRPATQREPVWSPRCGSSVGAYPPSPEDEFRSSMRRPPSTVSFSRSGCTSTPWVSSRGATLKAEAWSARDLDRERSLSPRPLPSSSSEYYRAPHGDSRVDRLCQDTGGTSSPRHRLEMSGFSLSHGLSRSIADFTDPLRMGGRLL
jgi:hypothetical protein